MSLLKRNNTETIKKILAMVDAIRQANAAAKDAGEANHEDSGTCNLDAVVIDFSGWRDSQVAEVAAGCGLSISDKLYGYWKGYRFVRIEAHGQGNLRTRMVHAATEKLKELGVKAMTYYAMD